MGCDRLRSADFKDKLAPQGADIVGRLVRYDGERSRTADDVVMEVGPQIVRDTSLEAREGDGIDDMALVQNLRSRLRDGNSVIVGSVRRNVDDLAIGPSGKAVQNQASGPERIGQGSPPAGCLSKPRVPFLGYEERRLQCVVTTA